MSDYNTDHKISQNDDEFVAVIVKDISSRLRVRHLAEFVAKFVPPLTYSDIARQYGVSRQYIQEILDKYVPDREKRSRS